MIHRYEKVEFVEFLIQACHGISINELEIFIELDDFQRKPSSDNKGSANMGVESQ